MKKDYERYGIAVDQVYVPADGASGQLTVLDVTTYADCGDVVVQPAGAAEPYRIDAFKLARVRYCLEGTLPTTRKETIYVHPGQNQCRVYMMPYPLRPGQTPDDLLPQFKEKWVEIALLNFQLKVVYIDPRYADLRDDIEGQMGGTYFTCDRPLPAREQQAQSSTECEKV